MKFDRSTIIGFILLAVLYGFYFYYNSLDQLAHQKEVTRQDSIAKAAMPKVDSTKLKEDALKADSVIKVTKAGDFQTAIQGSEQLLTAENELFKITFTNKGGQPKAVELKHFKNALDGKHVMLASTDFNSISYNINTSGNQSTGTKDLYFSNGRVEAGPAGTQIVSFDLSGGGDSVNATKALTHQFIIYPNDYKIDFNIKLVKPQLVSNGKMNLYWQYEAKQQEVDFAFEKQNTQIGFIEEGTFDYFTATNKEEINFKNKVNWIGVRQRFFNTFLSAKDGFKTGDIKWTVASEADAAHSLLKATTFFQLDVNTGANSTIPLSIYYGPSDYNILTKYDNGFNKLVNLGQGMYAFVRPVNQYFIILIFNFFKSFTASYGLIIALLTIFIRLLMSPLSYKQYLSGAKMKALKPEIAKLTEKFGNDQQAKSMEQMKLFREAGVNPMGGCLPALLQIPIFFALYSFFSANVDLRGQSFLWANDLSASDAVINFGFNIPLLGAHLSLFTLLAVITSFISAIYNMSLTPDQSNPMMKYMPYIFPFFLLFIFNMLPSALTWYYTVSNVITLAMQFVIQNYIIDHDKILVKIEENKKKPKSKSKWQERLEQMQDQQKQMQKDKNKK